MKLLVIEDEKKVANFIQQGLHEESFEVECAFDGESGLGLAGVHGVPRPRTWDAVASAQAPELPGDTATFVVLEEGRPPELREWEG